MKSRKVQLTLADLARSIVELGDVELLRIAFSRYPIDANASDRYGISLAHQAALDGNIPILELLHEHGASMNARTKRGFTPADWAFQEGHLDALQFIKEHGG